MVSDHCPVPRAMTPEWSHEESCAGRTSQYMVARKIVGRQDTWSRDVADVNCALCWMGKKDMVERPRSHGRTLGKNGRAMVERPRRHFELHVSRT